ncbi:MAG: hypothetical protein JW874_14425 [Spirochaetales bacterium]|nr:hypothetical protein [Spirochaetales bacterium]
MNRISILLFLLITAVFSVFSQSRPYVAVLPFSANGVSAREVKVVTGILETALVKTGIFDVIEQNEMESILETQAISLSGCTDESCAVELGQLLSAEQIVLGTFSEIGGQYVLTAKLIDVEKGRNLRAESLTFANMNDLQEKVILLGYALAGLTYSGGGRQQIAKAFGEILVETNPKDALIYINGAERGVSPDMFGNIPVGEVLVEARSGNMYAKQIVNVSEKMTTIFLRLKVTKGNIYIKTSVPVDNFCVYLDGIFLDRLDSGLFKDLPVGNHKLELTGDFIYWQGDIIVNENETTRVEAKPRAYGMLDYRLPEGAEMTISGPGFGRSGIQGSGIIDRLFTGDYSIKLEGPLHKSYKESITIRKGEIYWFQPESEYTDAYKEELEKLKEQERLAGLEKKEQEKLAFVEEKRRNKLNKLKNQIDEKERELHDLEAYLQKYKRKHKAGKGTGIVSFYVAGAGLALGGTAFFLGNAAYENYRNTQVTETAQQYRDEAELWQIVMISSLSVAGAGLLTGSLFALSPDRSGRIQADIDTCAAELAVLKAAYVEVDNE